MKDYCSSSSPQSSLCLSEEESVSPNDIASRVRRIVDNSGRKRRIYSTIHKDPKQSSRRFRANDRERRRMNSLNGALQALRGCVPLYHGKKRMTKLQILQFACTYINDLSEILCNPSSVNDDMLEDNRLNAMDTFMSYMSEQHFKENINHVLPPVAGDLNMMQRLDYLTIHSQLQMHAGGQPVSLLHQVSTMNNPVSNMLNGFS